MPNFNPQLLWERHVQCVLLVLGKALENLAACNDLPSKEIELDERLILEVRKSYIESPFGEKPMTIASLSRQAVNEPLESDDLCHEWIRKKPDFKWRLENPDASSEAELILDLDIESKRLGCPKKYTQQGIRRFISPQHRYGNGVSDGMMVGYLQTCEMEDLVKQVNDEVTKEFSGDASSIVFAFLPSQKVHKASQNVKRVQIVPIDFNLYHLWVDLVSRN